MTRSKPFSGKQKKDQLKEKKERKRVESAILDDNIDISIQEKRKLAKQLIKNNKLVHNNDAIVGSKIIFSNNQIKHIHKSKTDGDDEEHQGGTTSDEESSEDETEKSIKHINEINKQMESFDMGSKSANSGRKVNKLVTIFEKESRDEIDKRKDESKKPLNTILREQPWLIMKEYDKINAGNAGNYIDIPKRPHWSYKMSGDRLKEEERIMFSQWLEQIVIKYDKTRLNYFEHNLEVWRQLWRVSERSDVMLLVTDARYPLFHFPPSLYNYILHDLKKPMILILNKIDLVDKRIVNAWIQYFNINYPKLKVICFSSFSSLQSNGTQTNDADAGGIELDASKKRNLKKGRKRYDLSLGKKNLIEAIFSLPIQKLSLISKDDESNLLNNNDNSGKQDDNEESDEDDDEDSESDESDSESNYSVNEYGSIDGDSDNEKKEQSVTITIGMVGHPNVGKSSLINGMMGKKVVSTSRTPGHTKHFQTIVFTKNIQLLDCPGLVFPALDRPKQLQILCGLFPIAQVREPFSAIQYLAERVPVESIYNLSKPPDEENQPWSAYLICEAFALKRGYLYAKSGRPDPHRAGLEILKDCVDGNVVISWPPPNFTKEQYIESGLLDKGNSSNSGNIQQQQHDEKESNSDTAKLPRSSSSKKLDKKLKKQNYLKKLAYSEDENSEDENEDQDSDSDDEDNYNHSESDSEEMIVPVRSNKSQFLIPDDSEDDEDDSEEEDKPVKKTNKKTTSTTTTTSTSTNKPSPSTNNKKNNNKPNNKKQSTKESEYQERLKEKQNKGGNKRQAL